MNVRHAVRLSDREDEDAEAGGGKAEEPEHEDRQFVVVGEKTFQFLQVAGEHDDTAQEKDHPHRDRRDRQDALRGAEKQDEPDQTPAHARPVDALPFFHKSNELLHELRRREYRQPKTRHHQPDQFCQKNQHKKPPFLQVPNVSGTVLFIFFSFPQEITQKTAKKGNANNGQ